MANPYRPVTRQPSLADQVVEQILELITSGQLQPDERLPPERELAEQFDVSRTVIREAVRSLVAKGVLEVRPGSGMVISIPRTSSVVESMNLLLRLSSQGVPYDYIFEVRRVLEIEIVGLAAERATTEHLKDLEVLMQTMENTLDDLEKFAQTDVEFHAALANATQNILFSILLDSIAEIMLEVRRMGVTLPGFPEEVHQQHRRILERVKARDAEGARQAMSEHLLDGMKRMKIALLQQNQNGQATTES